MFQQLICWNIGGTPESEQQELLDIELCLLERSL